jgi:hypothetical protein
MTVEPYRAYGRFVSGPGKFAAHAGHAAEATYITAELNRLATQNEALRIALEMVLSARAASKPITK